MSRRPLVPALARALLPACVAVIAACSGDRTAEARATPTADARRARIDSLVAANPGYRVDSVLPIDEALRRFRADVVDTPTTLVGGAASAEALTRALAAALARRDTAAVTRLALSRAEFAFLYYPESKYTAPPFRQQPETNWMLLALASEKGERRLLERLGGAPLHVVAQRCDAAPERAGRNRVWSGCVVTVTGAPGRDTLSARLFGAIVERDGRYKILGYANDF